MILKLLTCKEAPVSIDTIACTISVDIYITNEHWKWSWMATKEDKDEAVLTVHS